MILALSWRLHCPRASKNHLTTCSVWSFVDDLQLLQFTNGHQIVPEGRSIALHFKLRIFVLMHLMKPKSVWFLMVMWTTDSGETDFSLKQFYKRVLLIAQDGTRPVDIRFSSETCLNCSLLTQPSQRYTLPSLSSSLLFGSIFSCWGWPGHAFFSEVLLEDSFAVFPCISAPTFVTEANRRLFTKTWRILSISSMKFANDFNGTENYLNEQ